MTIPVVEHPRRNPFATRHTRPGMLPPLDDRGEPIDPARLLAGVGPGRVVAVMGPHGHGKSTLVAAVAVAARAAGWAVREVRVRSPLESWRPVAAAIAAARGTFLACDGWERAFPGTATAVRIIAAARGLRVVVTVHRRGSLPILARCDTSPRLLAQLVARLPDHAGLISAHDVDDAYRRHEGNLREALYDLYDRFERQSRRLRQATIPATAASPPRR